MPKDFILYALFGGHISFVAIIIDSVSFSQKRRKGERKGNPSTKKEVRADFPLLLYLK